MDDKVYTFLILPGPSKKMIKVEVSLKSVYFALGVGIATLALLSVLGITYARMLAKVSDYNQLRSERENLREKVTSLASVVDHTNEKLDSIQSLARDVAVSYTFARRNGRSPFPRNVSLAADFLPGVGTEYEATVNAFTVLRANLLAEPVDLVKALFVTERDYLDLSPKPSIWPVQGYLTSHFGQRIDPFLGEGMFHPGMDISAPRYSRVVAPADGLVRFAGAQPGYGNLVIVSHGYGLTTKMAHLSKLGVRLGQQVKRGQLVGYVGSSGRATGPHLHYEILVNEIPVNPAQYLKSIKPRKRGQMPRFLGGPAPSQSQPPL